MCLLLPSDTGIRVGHTLQPNTWVRVSSHESSIWAAASDLLVVEPGEAKAFHPVDTMAPWSTGTTLPPALLLDVMQLRGQASLLKFCSEALF